MVNFVIGSIILVLGLFVLWSGRMKDNDFVLKTDVRKCFENTNWPVQTFYQGSGLITDKNGNTHFYAVKGIDETIEKLNKVLSS